MTYFISKSRVARRRLCRFGDGCAQDRSSAPIATRCEEPSWLDRKHYLPSMTLDRQIQAERDATCLPVLWCYV